MAVETKLRRWGNSMTVILPKFIVETKNLKENDSIVIEVVKTADLSGIFGSKKRKMSGQEFKDFVK